MNRTILTSAVLAVTLLSAPTFAQAEKAQDSTFLTQAEIHTINNEVEAYNESIAGLIHEIRDAEFMVALTRGSMHHDTHLDAEAKLEELKIALNNERAQLDSILSENYELSSGSVHILRDDNNKYSLVFSG